MATTVGKLLAILSSGDVSACRRAAQELARCGAAEAVEPLLLRLQDARPAVRAASAAALGVLKPLAAVDELFVASEAPEPEVAQAASDALAELAPDVLADCLERLPAVVPARPRLEALLATLRGAEPAPPDEDSARRLELPDAVVKVCTALVRHANPGVRIRAIALLAAGGGKRAVAALLAALNHQDPNVRLAVVDALARLRPKRWLGALAGAADDPELAVREAVWRGLVLSEGDLDPDHFEQFAPVYRDILQRADESLRRAAVAFLGRLRDRGAVDLLRLALGDPEEDVRLSVVETCRDNHHPDVLVDALNDPAAGVRAQAVWAAREVGVEELFDPLTEMLRDPNGQVRDAAVAVLGGKPLPGVDDLLRPLLDDPEEEVRARAGAVLTRRKTELEDLERRLADPDEQASVSAARLLAARAGSEAAQALLKAARDERTSVRMAAVVGIRDLLAPEAEQPLSSRRSIDPEIMRQALGVVRSLLGDPAARVRAEACWALRRDADSQTIDRLVRLLGDAARGVRSRATAALAALQAEGVDVQGRLAAAFPTAGEEAQLAILDTIKTVADRRSVPLLLEAARSSHEAIRRRAIELLADLRAGRLPRRPPRLLEEFKREEEPREGTRERSAAWHYLPSARWREMDALPPSSPMLAEPLELPEERPTALTDDVTFSLAAPRPLVSGQAATLLVWAYLDAFREEIEKRSRQELGDAFSVQSKYGVSVRRNVSLTVRLSLPGFEIVDPEDDLDWNGRMANARFPVTVPAGLAPGSYPGQALILLDGMRLAKLSFTVEVGDKSGPPAPIPVRLKRYRNAFASYASEDRQAVVGRIQGMQKIAPDLDVFLDVRSLRSGERWRERLEEEICRRDVLFLFWSLAASQSEWVDREWRTALEKRGIDYIDPVPLVSPDEVRPPPELAEHIHFDDWVLAYCSSPNRR